MTVPTAPQIVGLGEALFDVFPDEQLLGGAPLNVAFQAHQLVAGMGGSGVVASRVGDDELGRQVLNALQRNKMPTDYVQVDGDKATGRVLVRLQDGQPDYDIVSEVAWDYLDWTASLETLSQSCDAVCFGTLAQRSVQSRESITQFVQSATQAIRMFDANLRQSYYSRELIRQNVELANVLKLNEEEFKLVLSMLRDDQESPTAALLATEGTDAARAQFLMSRFNLDAVVITRGARGISLYDRNGESSGQPAAVPHNSKSDAVGAGDACSAAVLAGMCLGLPSHKIVMLANCMGAFVASKPGATPQFSIELRDQLGKLDGRLGNGSQAASRDLHEGRSQ